MPRYTRTDTINAIHERGLVPRVAPADAGAAKHLITALADGGAPVIELVHEKRLGPSVFAMLSRYTEEQDPVVILGAGGIEDRPLAEDYLEAGACFISGRGFHENIARVCNQRKVLYIPVCSNADEVGAAEELGAEWVGLLGWEPAGALQLLKNRPWTRVMPRVRGNTDSKELNGWIETHAACLNMRAEMIEAAATSGEAKPGLTQAVEALLWRIRRSRGRPLFTGVEHVGLYPGRGQAARELVQWYVDTFGFALFEGGTYFFAHSSGPGRIEVLEDPEDVKAHVAVKVSDFEAGCRHLQDLGVRLEPPKLLGRVKAVFLKDRDPAGNKVHLIYQAI